MKPRKRETLLDNLTMPPKRWRLAAAAALLLVLAATVTAFLMLRSDPEPATPGPTVSRKLASQAVAQLPPPDLVRPLAPEEAMQQNAERPFAGRPDTAAASFGTKGQAADDRERALKCLAQAIYYEAASEGLDGQRAVAQVVLNRVRHPGYPASVCGVVYQGSERTTGCQFSFTCDGSLRRVPLSSLWKQAERVAKEAMGGKVFAPVGHATHYHADYVLPYWADSLDKSIQVGRHLFYRFRGSIGSTGAFRQRYARKEPEPPSPTQAEVVAEAVDQVLPVENPLVPAPDQPPQQAPIVPPNSPLAADLSSGTLVLDGDSERRAAGKTPKIADCDTGENGKKVRALGANDLRSSQSPSTC